MCVCVCQVFEEPLVILIKLADRLHNMRTVFVLKPEKQKAVAEETMEVGRIGMVHTCACDCDTLLCACGFMNHGFA